MYQYSILDSPRCRGSITNIDVIIVAPDGEKNYAMQLNTPATGTSPRTNHVATVAATGFAVGCCIFLFLQLCSTQFDLWLANRFGITGLENAPKGLGPTRDEILAMDLKGLHDFMGFSCWTFAVPGLMCLIMLYAGWVGQNARTHLALFISFALLYTTIGSFLGDYWFCGANVLEELGLPQWQWQLLFNKMDNLNAWGLSVILALVSIYQSFRAPKHRFWYPCFFGLFLVAFEIKLLGVLYGQKFEKLGRDPDYFRWQLLCHSLWHIIACIAPCWLVYGLLMHGLANPWSRRVSLVSRRNTNESFASYDSLEL